MLVLALAVVMALVGCFRAADRGMVELSDPPLIEERTMDIVVRLRSETARVFQGATGVRDTAGAAEVETVLRRFGVNLTPQHPGVSDPELGAYFTVSGASPTQVERIAAALRDLDAVEAAYVQPPATPP